MWSAYRTTFNPCLVVISLFQEILLAKQILSCNTFIVQANTIQAKLIQVNVCTRTVERMKSVCRARKEHINIIHIDRTDKAVLKLNCENIKLYFYSFVTALQNAECHYLPRGASERRYDVTIPALTKN